MNAAVAYQAPPAITLTDEQNAAVEGLLAGLKKGKKIQTFAGLAGVGKTTTTRFLLERLPGWAVCAFTGKAANVLRRKGLNAQTIHSLIYQTFEDEETGKLRFALRNRLDCPGIVADEASMVSEHLFKDLRSFGLPLIFVGDHGQLEPVGSDFNLMREPDFRLETIHRNAGDIARFAEWVRNGEEPSKWPGRRGSEVVQFRQRNSMRLSELAAADQVICAYNRTRVALNRQIRGTMNLGPKLEAGERVMCLQNRRDRGLFNGQQGRVADIRSPKEKCWVFDFEVDGEMIRDVPISPKSFGAERLDSADWKKEGPVPFEWAYCATAHKMQGDEHANVVVVEERSSLFSFARWAYTSATRAKERLVWVMG